MQFVDKSHVRAFKQEREGAWLTRRGFDGLYSPSECACLVDDLYPCGERQDCRPGVKMPCDCGDCGEDGWHIGDPAVEAASPSPSTGEK